MKVPPRHLRWFLIAILAPCALLVWLTARTLEQDRQLASRQARERAQRRLDDLRSSLLTSLEKLRLEQLTAITAGRATPLPGVALVARIRGEQIRLPWEDSLVTTLTRDPLATVPPALALSRYREALHSERDAGRHCFARLRLAQTVPDAAEAQRHFAEVAAAPLTITDEFAVPLAFYAARRLAADARAAAVKRLLADARPFAWALSPAALYLLKDLTGSVEIDQWIRNAEAAAKLASESPRPVRPGAWSAYGDPLWLVSITPSSQAGDAVLLAVRADHVARDVQLSLSGSTALGEDLPGLRVTLPPSPPESSNGRAALVVAMLAVTLAAASLGGVLLWRDLRREAALAGMRAQFVASVSHELRTPLTSIRMFTETLKLDPDLDEQTRQEYLDTMLRETERLSRLLENVLDFSRIERGTKTYALRRTSLAPVVQRAARTFEQLLAQKGFTLRADIDAAAPAVDADSDALEQAIINLLGNAMKYSGDSREIELALKRNGSGVEISVTDHGIGMALAERSRIFERFYRAPVAENRSIQGAGLGLTLVAHIAEAHNGVVTVDSAPGRGSTFTLRLPAAQEAES